LRFIVAVNTAQLYEVHVQMMRCSNREESRARMTPGTEQGAGVADNVTELPRGLSIQGEQQKDMGWVRASDEDVDLYVDRVSDEVLACRERGRHWFPSIRQAGIHFSGVDDTGLLIRRLTCTSCGLAVRVEKWEGARRRGRTRFQRIASHLEYQTGRDGETYLAPSGRGRMTTRQIGDSVASKALEGQSLTALRKAARVISKTTSRDISKTTRAPVAARKTSNAG
jgi:hypothetical protein